jgi:hypothetical protein
MHQIAALGNHSQALVAFWELVKGKIRIPKTQLVIPYLNDPHKLERILERYRSIGSGFGAFFSTNWKVTISL